MYTFIRFDIADTHTHKILDKKYILSSIQTFPYQVSVFKIGRKRRNGKGTLFKLFNYFSLSDLMRCTVYVVMFRYDDILDKFLLD